MRCIICIYWKSIGISIISILISNIELVKTQLKQFYRSRAPFWSTSLTLLIIAKSILFCGDLLKCYGNISLFHDQSRLLKYFREKIKF